MAVPPLMKWRNIMRVLVPYKDVDGRRYSSPVVSGGIEKCIKNSALIAGVLPVEIFGTNYEDIVLRDFVTKVKLEKPDLVICHYPNKYFNTLLSERINVPIAWICHHTAGLAPDHQDVIRRMNEFVEKPQNTLWMVTLHQEAKWRKLGLTAKVSGYVPSSFVEEGLPPPSRRVYDAITIGRCDQFKDPFKLHRINPGSIHTLVMTNHKPSKYETQNLHWGNTIWDLPHSEVMQYLALSGVYFSTWPGETFGQTALEALARGVPVVLSGDEDGTHASQVFLVDRDMGVVAPDDKQALSSIMDFMSYGSKARARIADIAKENFNFDWWFKRQMNMIERAVGNG